jgi:hypothetical protein
MAQKPADLDQLIEHLGHALQLARRTKMEMTEHLLRMALLDVAQFIQRQDGPAPPPRRVRRGLQ